MIETAAYDERGHRLRILRTIFPNELDRLIKRLQSADSKEIEEQMNLEDEVFKDYYDLINENEAYKQSLTQYITQVDKERKAKEEAQKLAQQERQEKEEAQKREEEAKKREEEAKKREEEAKKREEQARKLAQQERQEKEEARKLAQQEHQRLLASARAMKQAGMSFDEIVRITGLPAEEIEEL